MKAKTTILTILLTLLVVGLLGGAFYLYQNNKPVPPITASEALKERNQAVDAMRVHDAVNQTNEAKLNERLTDTQNKLTNVCAALKPLTKTVNPNCL